MVKAGRDFELFVKSIYEEILALDDFVTLNVQHDINVLGKSGQPHQIDIYWEFNVADVTHRVAVECKEYKSTVSVGKVRDFYGALSDIGNINGIFVTTKGYQKGAITYASHKNISLKVVHNPSEKELREKQGINAIRLHMKAINLSNVVMAPMFDGEWIVKNTSLKEGDPLIVEGATNEIKLVKSNGENIGSIWDLENQLPRKDQEAAGLTHELKFDDAFIVLPNTTYPPLKIKSLRFTYDVSIYDSTSEIRYKLMAKAILTDIMTGKEFLFKKKITHN